MPEKDFKKLLESNQLTSELIDTVVAKALSGAGEKWPIAQWIYTEHKKKVPWCEHHPLFYPGAGEAIVTHLFRKDGNLNLREWIGQVGIHGEELLKPLLKRGCSLNLNPENTSDEGISLIHKIYSDPFKNGKKSFWGLFWGNQSQFYWNYVEVIESYKKWYKNNKLTGLNCAELSENVMKGIISFKDAFEKLKAQRSIEDTKIFLALLKEMPWEWGHFQLRCSPDYQGFFAEPDDKDSNDYLKKSIGYFYGCLRPVIKSLKEHGGNSMANDDHQTVNNMLISVGYKKTVPNVSKVNIRDANGFPISFMGILHREDFEGALKNPEIIWNDSFKRSLYWMLACKINTIIDNEDPALMQLLTNMQIFLRNSKVGKKIPGIKHGGVRDVIFINPSEAVDCKCQIEKIKKVKRRIGKNRKKHDNL